MRSILQLVPVGLLVLYAVLPDEASLAFPGIYVYMAFKTTIGALGLVPMMFGYGWFAFSLLQRVCIACGLIHQDEKPMDGMIALLASGYLGLIVMGSSMFLLGLISDAFQSLAYSIVAVGYGLFLYYRQHFFQLIGLVGQMILGFWQRSDSLLRWLAGISLVIVGLRFAAVFDYATHGDAYLYHLRMSEIWDGRGTTGVLVENITSGYSLAIEHAYFIFYHLSSGFTEHVLLVQFLHGFFGWLLTCYMVYRIARTRLEPQWAILAPLLLQASAFTSISMTAKNDAFALASVAIAAVALIKKNSPYFCLGCLAALCTKVTASLSFFILGLAFFSLCYKSKDNVVWGFKVLGFGAFLMLAMVSPYYINNFIVTGNPLFPILNQYFLSDFGPQTAGSIVSEMKPLSVNATELFISIFYLLKKYPIMVLAAFCGLIGLFLHRLLRHPRTLAGYAGIGLCGFFLLQAFLAPYQSRIEDRHFWSVIAGLMLVSLFILASVNSVAWRRRIWFAAFLVVVGSSSMDVAFRKVIASMQKSSLTESFLGQKPATRVNQRIVERGLLAAGEKVWCLSQANEAYRLGAGIFLHESISHPVWGWDYRSWNRLTWHRMIAKENIGLLIADEGGVGDLKHLIDSTLLREVMALGSLRVYDVRHELLIRSL